MQRIPTENVILRIFAWLLSCALVGVGPAISSPTPVAKPDPPELVLQFGHQGPIWSVAISHDDTTIASAGGLPKAPGEVKLWDARTGAVKRTLNGHGDAVRSVAISSDGNWVATGSVDGTVKGL